jgi:hypothetical protein
MATSAQISAHFYCYLSITRAVPGHPRCLCFGDSSRRPRCPCFDLLKRGELPPLGTEEMTRRSPNVTFVVPMSTSGRVRGPASPAVGIEAAPQVTKAVVGEGRPGRRAEPLPSPAAAVGVEKRGERAWRPARSPTRSKSTDILRTTSADIWRTSIGTESCADPADRQRHVARAAGSIQQGCEKRPRNQGGPGAEDGEGSERASPADHLGPRCPACRGILSMRVVG